MSPEISASDGRGVVFVGGTGRSGTHVVAKLLGKARELEDVRIECRFHCDAGGFPDLIEGRTTPQRFLKLLRGFWWSRYRGGGRPPDILPWWSLGRRPRGLHKLVDADRFEAACERFEAGFEQDPEGACRELFYDLLWSHAEAKQADGLVEMSCDNAAASVALARIFPEAKFVHTVRDGRDASASRVKQGRGFLYPRTRTQGIRWWEQRVRRIETAFDQLPDDRTATVSLDLMVQPRANRRGLKVMADMIGIPKQPRMRRYFRRKISPEHAKVGRWSKGLSERRQARVRAEYEAALERMERDGLRSAPLLREVYETESVLASQGAPLPPPPKRNTEPDSADPAESADAE